MDIISKKFGMILNSNDTSIYTDKSFFCKSNDSIKFAIKVLEGEKIKDLNNCSFILISIKNGKDVIEQKIEEFEIEDGALVFYPKKIFTSSLGNVLSELIIYNEDKSITTQAFNFLVYKSINPLLVNEEMDTVNSIIELHNLLEEYRLDLIEINENTEYLKTVNDQIEVQENLRVEEFNNIKIINSEIEAKEILRSQEFENIKTINSGIEVKENLRAEEFNTIKAINSQIENQERLRVESFDNIKKINLDIENQERLRVEEFNNIKDSNSEIEVQENLRVEEFNRIKNENIEFKTEIKSDLAQKVNFAADNTSNIEIPNVDEKLDTISKNYNEITSQLEQMTSSFTINNNFSTADKNNGKVIAVFIDDDGNQHIRDTLKPIFTSRNVPCCCAINGLSEYFNDKEYIDEMLDLQNIHNWEVLSHTMEHINLNTSSDEVIEEDCIRFLTKASKLGYRVNSIAYPWGAVTTTGRNIISKYFNSGFLAVERVNKYPNINQYGIGRYSLGSMMSDSLNTIEGFKTLIDNATPETCLVFMTHCGNIEGTPLIEQVVDYLISKNIPIVTVSEAIRSHGFKIYSDNFKMTYRGEVISDIYATVNTNNNLNVDSTTLPNGFPNGINIYTFGTLITGFPTTGGTLETQRIGGYSYWRQVWKPYNNTDIYTRIATSNTSWGSWRKLGYDEATVYFIKQSNYKAESDLCSTYPTGITTNIVTGYSCGNGILTTYNLGSNQYNKQELRRAGNNEVYSRVTLADGSWGAWAKISV